MAPRQAAQPLEYRPTRPRHSERAFGRRLPQPVDDAVVMVIISLQGPGISWWYLARTLTSYSWPSSKSLMVWEVPAEKALPDVSDAVTNGVPAIAQDMR